MARQAHIDVSLQSDLPSLKEVSKNATRRALTAARRETVAAIQAEVPEYLGMTFPGYKSKRGRKPMPGELRESIKELSRKTGEVEVGTRLYYAKWVEFGTHPHEETPKGSSMIAWPEGDHPVKKVRQHATENPFFRRGIAVASRFIPDVVASIFEDAIAKWEAGHSKDVGA